MPVYYREDERVAAYHLSPLRRSSDRLDLGRLAALAGWVLHYDEGRTVWDGIRLVRPFETVWSHDGGVERREDDVPPLADLPDLGPEALAKELRRLLVSAVARAAGSGRVAVMVSGGIDSSAVLAALLVASGAGTVSSLAVEFAAPGDDRPYLRSLERHFGISIVRIRPGEIPVRELFELDEAPCRHPTDAWTVVCARRAHEMGAERVLTGIGGDDFFGGDNGTAASAALLDGEPRHAFDALFAHVPYRGRLRDRLDWLARALLRPAFPEWLVAKRLRRQKKALPEWAGPRLREEMRRFMTERARRPVAHRRAADRWRTAATNPNYSEFVAEAHAQIDATSPIPRVDPLFDEELLRFLLAIPQHRLFTGRKYRGLLCLAMRDDLPSDLLARNDKSDFEPAFEEMLWPINDLRYLLDFEGLGRYEIVRSELFRQAIQPLLDAPGAQSSGGLWLTFWPALSVEHFLRHHA